MISLVAHTSGSLTREQTVELVDSLIAEGDPLGQGQGWAHFERTPAASREPSRVPFRRDFAEVGHETGQLLPLDR